jgi:Tat protein secretion system quality control protein TatD with DNase activity
VIDTHAHLEALDDPAGAVARARKAGVDRIVAIGSGLASARATLGLAESEQGVFAAIGIHPHQAADGESLEELRELVDGRAVAVETMRGRIDAGCIALAAAGHTSVLASLAGIRLPLQSHPLQALVSVLLEPVIDCVVMS